MTEVKLFDFFHFWFLRFLNCSNTQNTYLIIYHLEIFWILIVSQIDKFWKFSKFRNSAILEIWLLYEFVNNENLMIYKIVKLRKFSEFSKLEN